MSAGLVHHEHTANEPRGIHLIIWAGTLSADTEGGLALLRGPPRCSFHSLYTQVFILERLYGRSLFETRALGSPPAHLYHAYTIPAGPRLYLT